MLRWRGICFLDYIVACNCILTPLRLVVNIVKLEITTKWFSIDHCRISRMLWSYRSGKVLWHYRGMCDQKIFWGEWIILEMNFLRDVYVKRNLYKTFNAISRLIRTQPAILLFHTAGVCKKRWSTDKMQPHLW